jgi:hypothetical protein
MPQIYKYPLTGPEVKVPEKLINIPPVLEFLTVAKQGGHIMLWALVDTDSKEKVNYNFQIYGTGWEIVPSDLGLSYVGTVFDGPYVWHIYAGKEV